MDLSGYALAILHQDAEFVLWRGIATASPTPHPASVLVSMPTSERPGPDRIRMLEHELAMRAELQSVLPRLESMVRGEEFDPRRSQEQFRLAVTDDASITLMPPLIERMRIEAPDVRVEVSQWQDRAYDAVLAGRLDAAFSAEQPPSGLQSEILFEVDFVCVVGPLREFTPAVSRWPSIYNSLIWRSRRGRANKLPSRVRWLSLARSGALSSASHSSRQQCSQWRKRIWF